MLLGEAVSFRAAGRARADQSDPARSYVDVGEALIQWDAGGALFRIGMNTVFWGVTESRHLVDVVNQTDYRDDLDGDQKLGQLMAMGGFDAAGAGIVDVIVMTRSRAQRYPSAKGRPGVPIPILDDASSYEAGAGAWHFDFGARWSHYLRAIDWAFSVFHGTAREPELVPELTTAGPVLRPHYEVITQGGLELQWTHHDWLWKGEAIVRSGQGPTFAAVTAGLERTVVGVLGTAADLGVLLEYSYDGRDNLTLNIYDRDLFGGLRLALNDVAGTEILAGALRDVESGATFGTLEASRRLGERWTLAITGRLFAASEAADPLYWFRRDDYVELEFARHF